MFSFSALPTQSFQNTFWNASDTHKDKSASSPGAEPTLPEPVTATTADTVHRAASVLANMSACFLIIGVSGTFKLTPWSLTAIEQDVNIPECTHQEIS